MVAGVVDIVLACLLVGLLAMTYSALSTGTIAYWQLGIVPVSLMWGLLLGVGLIHGSLSALLFPLGTIMALILIWFIARFLTARVARVVSMAVVFGGQLLGFTWLMSFLRIVV